MPTAQITAKGQILIPEPLRDKLGFKVGQKVQWIEESGRLVITPTAEDPIGAATGFLRGQFTLVNDLRREQGAELKHKIIRKRSTTPAR